MPVVFGGPVADPWMVMKPPELETEVRTGGAWLLLPPPIRLMPEPPLLPIVLLRIALLIVPGPEMETPEKTLLKMTLPVVDGPPTTLPVELLIKTPLLPLPRVAAPPAV